MTIVRIVALMAATAALAGAVPTLPQKFENRRAGISLRYPRGWSATARPLTQLVSPAQAAAIASFDLRQRHPDTNCTPRRAFSKVGSRGAFIFVIEYSVERKSDFPSRPRRFRLPSKPHNFECFPGTYMLRFSDRGRYFQVHVRLGSHASSRTRSDVLAVLDSIVVRPG
jgi:hypothetical protein